MVEKKKPKKNELKELTSTLQHLQAEFENYKKRTEKESLEASTFFKKDLVTKLLPVLDMLELSLQHKENHEEFVKGIEMVQVQLKATLENEGLEVIESKNFNPEFHEAVITEKGENNKILEELQKGYLLNGKVIRFSRVKVGKQEVKNGK